ncbi:hypothetical protein M5K25_002849 [Dendrobium thyrsiflorum]|uniref:X8 domain-containing protein n=1 Tax=Dendrobium thyrsiflorum TaxID=117978 RepID=A0ABD0VNE8_DENTH
MEVLLVYLLFMMAMTRDSDGAWCVCRTELSDSALQKTLDYACGAGADCVPINQNGACYNPNTVKAHCSYAANSYYQRKGQAPQACDFAGSAILTAQDPSANGCTFPASPSAAGTGTSNNNGANTGTGVGMNPGTGTGTGTGTGAGTGTGTGIGTLPSPPTITNPGSTTPSIMTPTSSGAGGVIGPSGNTFSTDNSNGDYIKKGSGFLLLPILSSLVMLGA